MILNRTQREAGYTRQFEISEQQESRPVDEMEELVIGLFEAAEKGSKGTFSERLERIVNSPETKRVIERIREEQTIDGYEEFNNWLKAEIVTPEIVTRYLAEDISLEESLRFGNDLSLVARHEVTLEMLQHIEDERLQQELMAHHVFATFVELQQGISSVDEMIDNKYIIRSALVGALVKFGEEEPDLLENVMSQVEEINNQQLTMYQHLTSLAHQEAEHDPEKLNRAYISLARVINDRRKELFLSKLGIRAEVITHFILTDQVLPVLNENSQEPYSVYHAPPELDAGGVSDFFLVVGEGEESEIVMGFDVKSEPRGSREVDTIALLVNKRVQDEAGRYIVDKSDSDYSGKPISSEADDFVIDTGVPIIGIRVPTEWLLDDWGKRSVQGKRIKDLSGIANGKYRQMDALRAVTDSHDILTYVVKKCIEKEK